MSTRARALPLWIAACWIAACEWYGENPFRLSAALAFYTIFSLAPVLLIAVAVAGLWVGEQTATRQLLDRVRDMVGSAGASAAGQLLEQVRLAGTSPAAALAGALLLAAGSTAVFAELQSALNQIWDVEPSPQRAPLLGLLHDRLLSFALVLALGLLLLLSLLLGAALGLAEQRLTQLEALPSLWGPLRRSSSFGLAAALFAMIYKVLPDVSLRWRDVLLGALVTTLLFALGTQAIGLYLSRVALASRYGAAGSFVALLLWVYYSALVCLYGAELTQVYARRSGAPLRLRRGARRSGRKCLGAE